MVRTSLNTVQYVSVILLTIGQLPNILSEVAENEVKVSGPLAEDFDNNDVKNHHEKNLASSPDETAKGDPHYKVTDHKSHYNPKHFGYDKQYGPAMWPKMFDLCGGRSQSPVNLDTTSAVTRHHPHIMWWNYALKPRVMTVSNNGHTAVLTAKWLKEEDKPYHWSPPETFEYVFDQLHFHWGPDDHTGSEHTLNNERFPLEMHVVHHRRDLTSLEHAGHFFAGIRVIGVFFRISEREHNNTGLQQVVNLLKTVRMPGTSTIVTEPFPLSKLLPEFSNQYLTYNGSLTTPPCAETVSWVIRKEPLILSKQQAEEFRNLVDHGGQIIRLNYRPLQSLNGRTIFQIR